MRHTRFKKQNNTEKSNTINRSLSSNDHRPSGRIGRIKRFVLFTAASLMIVTSLTATGIAPYLTGDSTDVYAKSSKDTPTDRAEAYYYANGLVQCALYGLIGGGYITKSKFNSGDIFKANPIRSDNDDVWGAYGTYINSGASNQGSRDCGDNESAIMVNAAKSFGVSTTEMICGIGLAKTENGTPCGSSNADAYRGVNVNASQVTSWIRKTLGFDPFTLTEPARYIYSLNSLKGSCTRGVTPKSTKAEAGDKSFSVKAPDGTDAWYIYNKDYSTNTRVKYRSNPQTRWTCIQIINSINDSNAAYVTWQESNGNKDGGGKDESEEDAEGEGEASNCKIDGGLGWILCPVVILVSGMTDAVYDIVKNILSVQPIMTSGSGVAVYDTWKSMRNVANVAFVIAFLMIIFSQVTSIGLSNYNIKKMVPRLVMAAILVNISFWVCAVAVDLSNILGTSIKSVFEGMSDSMQTSADAPTTGEGFGYWSGLAAAILVAGTTLAIVGLSALLPALAAAFIAIITVFIVLTARQALIILLVVISPLAFVAMLLPNTENWFTRWRQLFQILLLMFPIIAGIFGASELASKVIMNSADSVEGGEGMKLAIQVMGAMVSIVPLALTPIVMKTAGGVLGRIGAFVNDPNKGPFDAMRRGAQGIRDLDKKRMRANRLNPSGNAWHKATGAGTRVKARMKYKSDKLDARLEAAEAGFGMENKDKIAAANFRSAAAGANSASAAAAIKTFDKDAAKEAIGHVGSTDSSLAAALRSQEKAGEDQMIKEFQNIHAPKDAGELKTALLTAVAGKKANVHEAQAIQNILDGMGNKGADVMGEVLQEAENGKEKMTNEMRVELARNMGGGMMSKNEFAKTWATSTAAEFNPDTGEMMKTANGDVKLKEGDGKNISYSDAKEQVLASEMKLDKLKGQSGSVQHEIIKNGIANQTMSTETMKNALNANNISSFESKDIKLMQDAITKAATSGGGGVSGREVVVPYSGPQPQASNSGTLTVEHTYKNAPPAAAPKNETIYERSNRVRDSNRDMTGN